MNEIQKNFRKEMGLNTEQKIGNNKLTFCKTCNKEIAKSVKKCPHCGKDQRNFFVRHKILTGILILLALGVIGNLLPHPDRTAPGSDDQKIEAFYQAQYFVKKELKAPSTAKFASYNDPETSVIYGMDQAINTDVYKVSSYVDAQNSFGVPLRDHFQVELKKNNNSWTLLFPVALNN